MKTIVNYFLILLFTGSILRAQKVTVSNEINVRNNYSYDILPNIDDHILFYHDKGFEHSFEIYDQNLRYKRTKQLSLEKRNVAVLGVIPADTSFNFYYAYRDDGMAFVRVNKLDKYGELIDSTLLLYEKSGLVPNKHRLAFSDDKSKVLLFAPSEGGLNMIMIDNEKLKVLYSFTILFKEFNFKSDFLKLVVSNLGKVYIAGAKEEFWSKKGKGRLMILRIADMEDISMHYFKVEENVLTNLKLEFDNNNQNIILAGMVSRNDEQSAFGYFGFAVPEGRIPAEALILYNTFSPEFLAELYGKKIGKVKELSNYKILDIIVRKDGGVIMVSEMQKEFARRSQINNVGRFGDVFPPRGFVDYYNEDLILLATYPSGKEHWKRVLFKKQFSQDDDGTYSSFFLFKTPSRLRLIYNDEIKNNNTVSEYVLDPIGNYERNSVLSTEYQNLKLRFRGAIQLSPSSLLVPSEKSSKINMVRIDFE